jgi:hypothetical protein
MERTDSDQPKLLLYLIIKKLSEYPELDQPVQNLIKTVKNT